MSPHVIVYSDGSCQPNPGPGGWAAVILPDNGPVEEISGAERDTTNNRMELTAAVQALRVLHQPHDIDFYTDSQYVRKGITLWLPDWVAHGWKTRSKEPVKNQDLWQALHAETQRHRITWRWVPGHAGHTYNERVDRLAAAARERLSSPRPEAPSVEAKPEIEIALRVSVARSGGPGGWAVRIAPLGKDAPPTVYTGREAATTANRLELVAALEALRRVPAGAAVQVYCSSEYLHNGMSGWVWGWQKRGWLTSSGTPVKHQDLWQALVEESARRQVRWEWERGDLALARGLGEIAADAVLRK